MGQAKKGCMARLCYHMEYGMSKGMVIIGEDDSQMWVIWVMIGQLSGLRRRHMVVHLCVRKGKSRTAIWWGGISQSRVVLCKL